MLVVGWKVVEFAVTRSNGHRLRSAFGLLPIVHVPLQGITAPLAIVQSVWKRVEWAVTVLATMAPPMMSETQ